MKTGSQIQIKRDKISLQNLESLFSLYLPIIGKEAICLYQFLFFSKKKSYVVDFLQYLQLSLSEFETLKDHLEAIHLMDTFDCGTHYLFVPNEPLSTQNFLNQPALCHLLKTRIGEAAFLEIQKNKEFSGQKISKQFAEVFVVADNTKSEKSVPVIDDFQLKSTNGIINEEAASDLTESEQKVINIAKKIAPQDFLATLKNQNQGYVTDDEIRIVQKLLTERQIASELVNMSIYYSLARNKQPKLTKLYMDTLILDWLQNNVKTALGAMNRIKQREINQFNKKKNTTSQSHSKVEQVPEWTKKKFDEQISKEDMAALDARFEKFGKEVNDE